MFARPRYHAQSRRARERGEEIRAAARMLTRLLGVDDRHAEWRDAHWQRPPRKRWTGRTEPRRFFGPPPRMFQRTPEPRQWRRYSGEDLRWGENRKQPPRPSPRDRRSPVQPRSGPPVAALKAPRWRNQEEGETRQPRGVTPRGTLQGSPARSADDLQRKPRGGLCGGPARSAKEPRTPPKKLTIQGQRWKRGKTRGEVERTHDRHRRGEWE